MLISTEAELLVKGLQTKLKRILSKIICSVIIPCYNEEKYIEQCLRSIDACDFDNERIEVLVVDGGSTDRTREIVEKFEGSFVRLVNNPDKIAPIAMNIGIEQSSGEYIFVISAHASYPDNYFSGLIDWIKKLEADCVGGVLITDVQNKNAKSNAIKAVLSNKFGVGNALFRTGVHEPKIVDTVAFGCYTRAAFEKYGVYDPKLVRNQDIELNKRIVNGGGKIYLVPDMNSTYFARETYRLLAKNNYQNGYWNLVTTFITGDVRSLSLRHFIPLFFVLSILGGAVGGFLFAPIWGLLGVVLLAYFSLIIKVSSGIAKSYDTTIGKSVWAFLSLHFAYGSGSFLGMFQFYKMFK